MNADQIKSLKMTVAYDLFAYACLGALVDSISNLETADCAPGSEPKEPRWIHWLSIGALVYTLIDIARFELFNEISL